MGAAGLAGRRGRRGPLQVLVPAPAAGSASRLVMGGPGGAELQHILVFYFLSVLYSLLVSPGLFFKEISLGHPLLPPPPSYINFVI